MTRDELAQRIQNYFENPTYYTSDDLNGSIQDAYNQIGAFTGLFVKAAVIPFVANLTYYDMLTLLPDYVGVVAIFNVPIKRWMGSSNISAFDKDRLDWETALGTPYYFSAISHRYIAIYKKPSTPGYGNMYVYYKASSPVLGPNDEFAIPSDFINTAEDYVISDLWAQNQEWTKAKNHLGAYLENLNDLRVWINSQRNPDRTPRLNG